MELLKEDIDSYVICVMVMARRRFVFLSLLFLFVIPWVHFTFGPEDTRLILLHCILICSIESL